MRAYRWSFSKSARVNWWWFWEHLGYYRGADGGLLGYVRRYGYAKRHDAQRGC